MSNRVCREEEKKSPESEPQELMQTLQYLLHLSVDALTHLSPAMSDQN